MFIDGRTLDPQTDITADVCIIGAGAAGITIARELAGQPFKVCLLESGGVDYEPETHELTELVTVGRVYDNDPSRLRYWGGTTNHWGGHCLPIRSLQFSHRPGIPYSGWPITRVELDPYYRRAQEILQLGPYNYDPQHYADLFGMPPFPLPEDKVNTVMSLHNPLRFGAAYQDDLENADNVDIILYANVAKIARDDVNAVIDHVDIETIAGNAFTVSARYFILAAGGIENARILLLSNDVETAGLGNENDLVGRFFMEHLWYSNGALIPMSETPYELYGMNWLSDEVWAEAHLALPEEIVLQEEIADFRAQLSILNNYIAYDGVNSAYYLSEKLGDREVPERLGLHLYNMINDLGPIVEAATDFEALSRRLNSPEAPLVYRLHNFTEQVPNPDSRITLADRKDRLGLNLPQLDWRLSDVDARSLRRSHELIAQEVGRSGFGRVRIELPDHEDLPLEDVTNGGHHHMGTTRMHDDPKQGVVDRECRVHGYPNLFIAGSSVFSTGGFANPTMTLVALAARLADHVKEQFQA